MNALMDNPSFIMSAVLVAAALVVLFTLWRIYACLSGFLEENVQASRDTQELLMDLCDYTGEKMESLNASVSGQVQAMRRELLDELSVIMQKMPGDNSQALSELGSSLQVLLRSHEDYRTAITAEVRQVGSLLSGELNVRLEDIANGLTSLREEMQLTLSVLQESQASGAEVPELTSDQKEAIKNLNESIANLAKFAADIQGALAMHQGNVLSVLEKMKDEVMKTAGRYSKAMEEEYKKNLKEALQLIADNLRAIHMKLSEDIKKRGSND